MIEKHSDRRVITIPTEQLHAYRWAMDTALTAVEAQRDAAEHGQDRDLYVRQLKLLDAIRMAVHEDYG